MKRLLTTALTLVALLAGPLRASVCNAGADSSRVDGSKVDHYITDAALHRSWAVAVNCSHPEQPWTLKEVPWRGGTGRSAVRPTSTTGSSTAAPLIPAGAKVRLWHIADGANIDLSGTALDAGADGQMIHVRIGQRGTVLEGRVRGAGSVELFGSDPKDKRPDRWNAQ